MARSRCLFACFVFAAAAGCTASRSGGSRGGASEGDATSAGAHDAPPAADVAPRDDTSGAHDAGADADAGCSPIGDERCRDERIVEECSPNARWVAARECPADRICIDAHCAYASPCEPGEAGGCDSETARSVCDETGRAFVPRECPEGGFCLDGACGAQRCHPDQRRCVDATTVQECADDGTDWGRELPCGEGSVCLDGRCQSGCDLARKVQTYFGCEYWTADLDQYEDPFGDPRAQPHAVVLSNPGDQPAVVEVTTRAPGVVVDFPDNVVAARSSKVFTFPRLDVDDTGISPNSFFIQASRPVIAHQFNPLHNVRVYSNDASLLLPVHALGTEYMGMTWPSGPPLPSLPAQSGYLTVIATTPGRTSLLVIPTCAIEAGDELGPFEAGELIRVALDQYQVLNLIAAEAQLALDAPGTDLTGTIISADQPVAVFGGHEEAVIGDPDRTGGGGPVSEEEEGSCCAEHLEQQLFPVNTWGRRYVAAKAKPRGTDYDGWKVLAARAETQITTDPPVEGLDGVTLGQTESVLVFTDTSFELTATGPVLVGQFLISQEQTSEGIGDPAFILSVPVEQLRSHYVFLVPLDYAQDWVTLVRSAGEPVQLDGQPVPEDAFHPVGGGSWEIAYRALDSGVHEAESEAPFGLYAYGFDSAVSYGYPGGLDLRSLMAE